MMASQLSRGTLTAEQWQLVEALGSSLTPEHAYWISGYFAGLGSALLRSSGTVSQSPDVCIPPVVTQAEPVAARSLTILHISETGNSTELAIRLAALAVEQGLSPTLVGIADYKVRKLKEEQDLLIITSTHGEGDPPQSGMEFFEFVEGRKAPSLSGLRYAILALGDMSYEHFCGAGKRLDERFEALGAKRLQPRVDCDVDYEDPAAVWSTGILALLAAEQASAISSVASPSKTTGGTQQANNSVYSKRNPFPATVIDNIVLSGRGSTRETHHIEISLADSGLTYEPGDALGIAAHNDPAMVEALLAALSMNPDAPLTVKGQTTTLFDALGKSFEITTATLRFLDHWGELTGTTDIFSAMDNTKRAAFLHDNHIIDIIRAYPLKGLDPQRFVDGLRPLQPRLYSIASSLSICPDEAHITIAPVRYKLHGEPRSGVASGHLADRAIADSVLPVYIQSNPHFRLPSNGEPIIMIGAGTGVAPYRAFMQEREANGGGRSWMFFGERNFRTDFLYQTEWQDWLKNGVLTKMEVAFSRDGAEKVYVQHRIYEHAHDVYAWLEEGAYIYLCGDASHMAPDVHNILVTVIEEQASVQREEAEEYLRDLQRDGRYQRDVY
ncbi:MAG TPA: assimilatory sulfite reductase (NADPH) flavoprotein subunit [Nitrosomonas europaea]|uniref:assimilatory sulfite reductase (NADPH) flavoprotein subunit n=1 Tax=Nitrosomonas europaea TaxID=915 RepID=UPI0024906D70|nr:assimilatory sulfite reductase (NADPH) flavoprotein subunit [Nitrosomonas europaea]HRN81620.1 assimilatory sulfite reductase (NADPH) flavoprotein subunit [Nitrosomonas europaea]HRO55266.1 assimilatory sulfite reductase (NADPH) flavoprotein subunit [Nitrosomonas europaea]HRQ08264.1 assimilatory sulfite reductase (NADPH) flavoprotein subunit [Nitrosomonas europaea]HUM73024.1 assimilatory sulfite reductase (NADPH) flavoprotein subunit [Nitrosomonas europaea]